jgi:hypothetical protein
MSTKSTIFLGRLPRGGPRIQVHGSTSVCGSTRRYNQVATTWSLIILPYNKLLPRNQRPTSARRPRAFFQNGSHGSHVDHLSRLCAWQKLSAGARYHGTERFHGSMGYFLNSHSLSHAQNTLAHAHFHTLSGRVPHFSENLSLSLSLHYSSQSVSHCSQGVSSLRRVHYRSLSLSLPLSHRR